MVFSNFGAIRVDWARSAVLVIFLSFLEFSLFYFGVRRSGNVGVFQTVLLISKSADIRDPLNDADVNELLNDVHHDHTELEDLVGDDRAVSRLPQVDSVDELVVAPEIVALLCRPPYG